MAEMKWQQVQTLNHTTAPRS